MRHLDCYYTRIRTMSNFLQAGSWLRRHEPKNNSDLAVNGEKVNEVRDFLSVSQQVRYKCNAYKCI